jgi:hypothetical protein
LMNRKSPEAAATDALSNRTLKLTTAAPCEAAVFNKDASG